MIGFNHALTGGLIATLVPWPLAIPLALASHFLLDMLPHYGIPHQQRDKSKFWKWFFTVDFFATLGLAVWAIANQHYAMYFAGQVAVLPDFVWVAHVVRHRSFELHHSKSRYAAWHKRIQHYERPWGLWVEIPLAAVLFYIVVLGA
ncbi:hypothetical protein EYC59_04200 [Candidatus Saccharibacteria bacterium]|nr:MAG: hypothetical protein EYC59_04200 [Candidatus Saccharibacteria bacterium]